MVILVFWTFFCGIVTAGGLALQFPAMIIIGMAGLAVALWLACGK